MTSQRQRGIYGGLICLALGTVLWCYAHAGLIANQLNAWKLLPRPERLTELYFMDVAALPTKATVGQSQVVKFAVHNLEAQTVAYNYTVLLISADDKTQLTLREGAFTLATGYTTTMKAAIVSVPPRAQVQVRLSYQSIPWGYDRPVTQVQQISFRMHH